MIASKTPSASWPSLRCRCHNCSACCSSGISGITATTLEMEFPLFRCLLRLHPGCKPRQPPCMHIGRVAKCSKEMYTVRVMLACWPQMAPPSSISKAMLHLMQAFTQSRVLTSWHLRTSVAFREPKGLLANMVSDYTSSSGGAILDCDIFEPDWSGSSLLQFRLARTSSSASLVAQARSTTSAANDIQPVVQDCIPEVQPEGCVGTMRSCSGQDFFELEYDWSSCDFTPSCSTAGMVASMRLRPPTCTLKR